MNSRSIRVPTHRTGLSPLLGGFPGTWLAYFFHILEIVISTDVHIFQRFESTNQQKIMNHHLVEWFHHVPSLCLTLKQLEITKNLTAAFQSKYYCMNRYVNWIKVWCSIWHIFWRSILSGNIWHMFWHIYLAPYLAYVLAFYLVYIVTFYLA